MSFEKTATLRQEKEVVNNQLFQLFENDRKNMLLGIKQVINNFYERKGMKLSMEESFDHDGKFQKYKGSLHDSSIEITVPDISHPGFIGCKTVIDISVNTGSKKNYIIHVRSATKPINQQVNISMQVNSEICKLEKEIDDIKQGISNFKPDDNVFFLKINQHSIEQKKFPSLVEALEFIYEQS